MPKFGGSMPEAKIKQFPLTPPSIFKVSAVGYGKGREL